MEAALGLWRRLDTPGHDACRLEQGPSGWKLQGMAIFVEQGTPVSLDYLLECDPAWRSARGRVRGWIGPRDVELDVARSVAGVWSLNGTLLEGLESCLDLDFGFTPATNLSQLCRIALQIGQSTDVPVAWLDAAAGTLALLPQRYERRSATTYWYESPTTGYSGLLEVEPDGFVRRYPELWEREP
jgi:hypothetical protein